MRPHCIDILKLVFSSGLFSYLAFRKERVSLKQFSALERQTVFKKMESDEFDLLIIGGGITGAGISLDAVTRGLKVALVEMQDFASGTSSRSTKLVHGGLRYLKQFEVREVAELGRERAIVYENGPHVTTPEWMLLPFHEGGTFGKMTTSLGLKVYDFLAGVKKSERRKMLTREETLKRAPIIKKEGLLGGGLYVEYRTDDARLTIEVLKEAFAKGAVISNYAKADQFIYDPSRKAVGAEIVDVLTGEQFSVKAKMIINATGPWVDSVRELDSSKMDKHLILSKGVHLVFDQSVFPLSQSIYFDTPDGRMVFAIPRDGKTYVGTTDTFYEGNPKEMTITEEDRQYILKSIHYMFPKLTVLEEDIESSWAGVRPLIHEGGKGPSEISRKDEIWESDSGLITIAGGKLTGYRKMAQTVVDLAVRKLKEVEDRNFGPCVTKKLPISGGDFGGSFKMRQFIKETVHQAFQLGLNQKETAEIVKMYGTNSPKVLSYVQQNNTALPDGLYARLMYTIHEEMTIKPVDFFVRRTGKLLFDISTVLEWKDEVVSVMAETFGWTEIERETYSDELDREIIIATIPQ